MKVKCIATRISDEQKKSIGMKSDIDPSYDTSFVIGKEYVVLGISHDTRSEYWTTHLVHLKDELGGCTYAPICLFEIIDPRPSIFWRAKIMDDDLVLWPVEFYREFFHDDLSEGKPEIKKVFDIVVDRLTYEFEDATAGLPDPLAWPFEEYK